MEIPNENISNNEQWVSKVKKTVSAIKKTDNTKVYLVKYSYPSGGIEAFINKLKTVCDSDYLR